MGKYTRKGETEGPFSGKAGEAGQSENFTSGRGRKAGERAVGRAAHPEVHGEGRALGVSGREGLARILLTGLTAYGYHGCTAEERERGQVFRVDLELEYDASAAVRKDDLSLAVDYDRLAMGIRDIVCGEPFRLIESLAAEIGRYVMAQTPAAWARVRVHKPEAPLGCEVDDVAVEMVFRRQG